MSGLIVIIIQSFPTYEDWARNPWAESLACEQQMEEGQNHVVETGGRDHALGAVNQWHVVLDV